MNNRTRAAGFRLRGHPRERKLAARGLRGRLGFVLAALGGVPAFGQTGQVKPLDLALKLEIGGEVSGPALDATDDLIVLDYGGRVCALEFGELTAASAYSTKRALLAARRGGRNRLTAGDHFELGRYALSRDRAPVARDEFAQAARLDADLRPRIDDLWKEYRRDRAKRAASTSLSPLDSNPPTAEGPTLPGLSEAAGELEGETHTDGEAAGGTRSPGSTSPTQTGATRPGPDSEAALRRAEAESGNRFLALYHQFGESVRDTINPDLVLVETPHFLIWTDWRADRREALADWTERMYAAVAGQLGLDPGGNVFLGKCPVFCFRSKARFLRFGRTYDGWQTSNSTGYTRTGPGGHVHLAVYLRSDSPAELNRFAGTLVHEGVHAFVHRYGRDGNVGGWVGEGLANYLAERVLGDRCLYGEAAALVARQYVLRNIPIQDLLRRLGGPQPHEYPVAHSLVEFLIQRDSSAFSLLLVDLKGKPDAEACLTAAYGLDFPGLEAAWREHVRESDERK